MKILYLSAFLVLIKNWKCSHILTFSYLWDGLKNGWNRTENIIKLYQILVSDALICDQFSQICCQRCTRIKTFQNRFFNMFINFPPMHGCKYLIRTIARLYYFASGYFLYIYYFFGYLQFYLIVFFIPCLVLYQWTRFNLPHNVTWNWSWKINISVFVIVVQRIHTTISMFDKHSNFLCININFQNWSGTCEQNFITYSWNKFV